MLPEPRPARGEAVHRGRYLLFRHHAVRDQDCRGASRQRSALGVSAQWTGAPLPPLIPPYPRTPVPPYPHTLIPSYSRPPSRPPFRLPCPRHPSRMMDLAGLCAQSAAPAQVPPPAGCGARLAPLIQAMMSPYPEARPTADHILQVRLAPDLLLAYAPLALNRHARNLRVGLRGGHVTAFPRRISHLPRTSLASPSPLPRLSLASPSHLPRISLAPPLHLPRTSLAPPLHLPRTFLALRTSPLRSCAATPAHGRAAAPQQQMRRWLQL